MVERYFVSTVLSTLPGVVTAFHYPNLISVLGDAADPCWSGRPSHWTRHCLPSVVVASPSVDVHTDVAEKHTRATQCVLKSAKTEE